MLTSKIGKQILFSLCILITSVCINHSYANSFNIIVSSDVKSDYLKFLDGRDPLTIKDFNSPFSRRDVIELVLLQQALFLGNNTPEKTKNIILTSPSSKTNMRRLNTGNADIIGTSVWKEMFNQTDQVLFTKPTIENGKFEAGLYTGSTNFEMLSSKSKASLSNKSAVSSRRWIIDWQTLSEINVDKVWHTESWGDMVKMVNNRQADFLLAPFQANKKMTLTVGHITLIPVQGVKVLLHSSRHFAISKRANQAQQILDRINRGITTLQAKGLIDKAYIQSGFYNQQVKNWTVLN